MPISILYSLSLEIAIKSIVSLGAAAVGTRLLRRQSAAVRHLLWTLAFGAVLSLPVLSRALPSLRLPLPSTLVSNQVTYQATASVRNASSIPLSDHTPLRRTAPSLLSWGSVSLALWAAGTAFSLLQTLFGLVAVRRLRQAATSFDVPEFAVLVQRLDKAIWRSPVGYFALRFACRLTPRSGQNNGSAS